MFVGRGAAAQKAQCFLADIPQFMPSAGRDGNRVTLAHLAFLATGSPFVAERWPNELAMVAGLLSRGHRENLREAKRERAAKTLNVLDVVRSVAALEAAARVAPSLGMALSLIHISEPPSPRLRSDAVFCLKK